MIQNGSVNKPKISILGSGWLGLPLALHLKRFGYLINTSTTSHSRLIKLKSIKTEPFIIDINNFTENIHGFLNAHILIINITSKNINSFSKLNQLISESPIEKVLFISSTSVYQANNSIIKETDGMELKSNPLWQIEQLFTNNLAFKTTVIRMAGLIGYERQPGRFFQKGKTVKNSEAFVNLIHRDDCIGIIDEIIKQDCWGEIFNACADTHPTKREFYSHAAQSINEPTPEFDSQTYLPYKIINNEKLKKKLAYQFLHPDLMGIKFKQF